MQDPTVIQRLVIMHVFEGIQEIDDHYSQYCNTDNMIPVTIERLYESHQRSEETVEEACRNAEDAKHEWLMAAIEEDMPIPEPDSIED